MSGALGRHGYRALPRGFAHTGAISISQTNEFIAPNDGQGRSGGAPPPNPPLYSPESAASEPPISRLTLLLGDGPRHVKTPGPRFGEIFTINPLRYRIPVLNITLLMALSLLGAAVHSILLIAAMCDLGLPPNTPLWPFIVGWALAAFAILHNLLCLILAIKPPMFESATTAQLHAAALRYMDASKDVAPTTIYSFLLTVVGVFSLLWVVLRVPGSLPLNPTLEFQAYVTQQLLFVLYTVAHFIFIAQATLLHTNRSIEVTGYRQ